MAWHLLRGLGGRRNREGNPLDPLTPDDVEHANDRAVLGIPVAADVDRQIGVAAKFIRQITV